MGILLLLLPLVLYWPVRGASNLYWPQLSSFPSFGGTCPQAFYKKLACVRANNHSGVTDLKIVVGIGS